jgi:hypothetical protein
MMPGSQAIGSDLEGRARIFSGWRESRAWDLALPIRDGAMHAVEARLFKNDVDRLACRRAWLTAGSGDRRP